MVPTAMPPIRAAEPKEELKCPAIAISTIPTSGTVIFAKMLGSDNLSISLVNFMTVIRRLDRRICYRNFLSSSSMPR